MSKDQKERPVVVTTAHRGIFVGYTDSQEQQGDTITLKRARMVVYYSRETRSVMGVASRGVADGSKVSSPVQSITLRSVTAVMEATEEAAAAWEAEPWG